VDAAVDAVGVQDDGAMVVPAEVDRVGWYRYGPEPGAAEGNAVLAGHVDTIAQGPGALFELRGVEIGAEVVVTDAAGTEHRYQVVSRQTITKTDLPVEQVFARAGEHRLVVITCGGEYLPGSRRYADNVVVTAVPVVAP
jgi:sortase (surface protein transpeptidase)